MSSLNKIFAWVAIAAALFIAGMTFMSRRQGSGVNEYSIVIDRSPAEVFPWLTEPYRLTRWIDGLESSVPISGDSVARGAKSRETVLVNGKRYSFVSEILQVKRDTLLQIRIESEPPKFTVGSVYLLSPHGAGTRLHYIGHADYASVFARVMEPIVTMKSQKKIEADMKHLKELVEAQPGPRGI